MKQVTMKNDILLCTGIVLKSNDLVLQFYNDFVIFVASFNPVANEITYCVINPRRSLPGLCGGCGKKREYE